MGAIRQCQSRQEKDHVKSDIEVDGGLSCSFDLIPIALTKNQRKIKSINEMPK